MGTKIKLIGFVALLCFALSGWTEGATHRVRSIGAPATAFYLPSLKTPDDLRKMMRIRKADVQKVLVARGWTGNIDDLMNAVENGQIAETSIAPGAQLPFMAYRRGGKAGAIVDVTWAGAKPFEAYYIDFESGGSGYRFYVPRACSNFWIESRFVPKAPEPPPPPPPAPAPVPPPPPVPAPVVEPPPPPPPVVEPVKEPLFFVAGLIGKERVVQDVEDDREFAAQCDALLGAEFGIMPRLGKSLQAQLSVGLKVNLENGDESSIFIDAALNAVAGRAFFGGGVSFWDLTEDDTRTVSLLLQLGFDLNEARKWQFVAEGRIPFDQFDDVSNNYQFWGGFRYRF